MPHFHERRSAYSEQRKSPLPLILIVLAITLALTVLIGNLLPLFLSDAALEALRGDGGEKEPPRVTSSVKKLRAYAYLLGGDLGDVWENPHASVSLNAPSSSLAYTSTVAGYLGYSSYRSAKLAECMEELDEAATYISGVFYPRAPYLSSEALRDAEAAKETALMREFLRAGGDEILLRDLPFGVDGVELEDILSYVETVATALGDSPTVVAVPLFALSDGKSAHRILSRLADVADRLALDLGAADGSLSPEDWLKESDYFLRQYEMRLLLSETQTDLALAADGYADLQTFTRIPATQLSRPE